IDGGVFLAAGHRPYHCARCHDAHCGSDGVVHGQSAKTYLISRRTTMEPVAIPRRIDDPPHILLWSADEILPMMFGLVIGIIFKQALLCFLIGFAVTNLYKRFRDDHADGVLLHMLYW